MLRALQKVVKDINVFTKEHKKTVLVATLLILTLVFGVWVIKTKNEVNYARANPIEDVNILVQIDTPGDSSIIVTDNTLNIDKRVWKYKQSTVKDSAKLAIPILHPIGSQVVINLTQKRGNIAKFDTNIAIYVKGSDTDVK